MNIDFECTQCGKCCHDLKLPLSVDESIKWIRDGHEVVVLCEAIPWPADPAEDDRVGNHKRGRSFAAWSGTLPIRVIVTLAASFDGPCPHLQEDRRCGNYAERPRVCRIYPAEIHPFLELDQRSKACPDDAWGVGRRPLVRNGQLVDSTVRSLVQAAREADQQDVPAKEEMCFLLGLDAAAMANEGFVIHSPERTQLLNALCRDGISVQASAPVRWQFVSNQRATVDALFDVGAVAVDPSEVAKNVFDYVGFRPAAG